MAADGVRPRFSYIPGLDGIRGIWVVIGPLLYHAATDTVTGGILGIDLFFTLSSYLIISIALNEFEKTGRIDLDTKPVTGESDQGAASDAARQSDSHPSPHSRFPH